MRGKATVVVRSGSTLYEPSVLEFPGASYSLDGTVLTVTVSGGGGGTSDHAALSHLAWSSSAHTGTADHLAGFNGSGATTYYNGATVVGQVATTAGDLVYGDGAGSSTRLPIAGANHILTSTGTAPQWSTASDVRTLLGLVIGTNVQAYDAGLTSLTSADATAGLPYVTGANTWANATYSGMFSVVSGAWKVVGLRESGGPTDLGIGAIGDGQVLVRSGSSVVGQTYSEGFDGFFEEMAGSGITGNVTFDGSSAVTGWALASRIYTLSAVTTGVEFDTLTIDTTGGDVTLVVKGMPIYGLALALLGSGTVYFDWSGSDASGITAGAGASAVASAPFGAGANGGAGRTTSGNGNNATALSSSYILLAPDPTLTYNGGSCGSATPRNGGADSNYTNVWNSTRYGGLLEVNARGFAQFAAAIYPLQGSPGGGGGALGEGTGGIGTSGAGAGGAGYIRLGFRSISTGSATLVVRANGGDGSSGVNTNNSEEGGGMGGWGGIIYMTALSVTGTNPIQTEAVGGNGGNGDAVAGAHGAGGDGGPGGRILIVTPASMASKFATPNVSGGAKGSTVGTPATAAKDGSAGAYLIREFG